MEDLIFRFGLGILVGIIFIWWWHQRTPKDLPKDWKERVSPKNLLAILKEFNDPYGTEFTKILNAAIGPKSGRSKRSGLMAINEFLSSMTILEKQGQVERPVDSSGEVWRLAKFRNHPLDPTWANKSYSTSVRHQTKKVVMKIKKDKSH